MNVNLLKLLNKLQDSNNKNNKELLLKYLLLELNKLRLNKNINILAPEGGYARDINKYIKELSNKGNKLQHLNLMNT